MQKTQPRIGANLLNLRASTTMHWSGVSRSSAGYIHQKLFTSEDIWVDETTRTSQPDYAPFVDVRTNMPSTRCGTVTT